MSNLYQDVGQIKITPRTAAQVIDLNQPPRPEEISANLHRHQQSLLSQRSPSTPPTSVSAPELPSGRRQATPGRSRSYNSELSEVYRPPPNYPGSRRIGAPVYENLYQSAVPQTAAPPPPQGASSHHLGSSVFDYLRQSPRSSLSSDSSPHESILEPPPAYSAHLKPPQPLPGQPPIYANLADLKIAPPPPPPYKPPPVQRRIEELEKEMRAPSTGPLLMSLAGLSLGGTERKSPPRDAPPAPAPASPSPVASAHNHIIQAHTHPSQMSSQHQSQIQSQPSHHQLPPPPPYPGGSKNAKAMASAQSVQAKLERMTKEIEEEMERQAPDGEFFGECNFSV